MRVVRTQWPVGQGCFATGIIDPDGAEPQHYVYDCGARNVTDLAPIVATYADKVKKIEALFISHLDGDHVDGLDHLLATVKATTVYLPYLDMAQGVANLLEADAAGRLSGSLIQAQLDPVRWFGSRGVDRVVLVRNNGEAPEGGYLPSDSGGGPRTEREERVYLKLAGVAHEATAGHGNTAQGGTELLEMIVGGAVMAMLGRTTKWLLVPYVPYIDLANISAFRDSIRAVLGLKPNEPITADAVQSKLRDKEGRSELRNCYDEILKNGAGSNHNKVSMSLYSGPDGHGSKWQVRRRFWHWDEDFFYPTSALSKIVGWIGTGDAKLRSKRRRSAWEQFYRQLRPLIGTMLLPHHGSKENWHSDLLSSTAAELFVAAADEQDKGYNHPSQSVVVDIQDAGHSLAHVTRRPNSRLVEIISEF